MLHHPDGPVEFLRQPRRRRDRAECAIENVVSSVAEEQFPILQQPRRHAGAPLPQPRRRAFPPERNHLDGHRAARTQPVHQFALVHHDHEPLRGARHDLLAQQRPAQALDQVQGGALHLVGAVDGEMNALALLQSREWNAQRARLRGRLLRGWNPGDPQTRADAPADRRDRQGRRGAGAQPYHHSVFHQGRGGLRGSALRTIGLGRCCHLPT